MRIVAGLITLVGLSAPLAGQSPRTMLDVTQTRRIDSLFARFTGSTPGCALAVTKRDTIVYQRGYGLASMEQRVPITPSTVFDLGSVSKQFTAASILLLQLDGKLSLDDDVRRYLPELPSLGATVTLRHLITHTSGWRDYNDLLMMDGFDERDHTTDRDAWDSLKRQRALNFAPGSAYQYSNTGFFLLAEVVKRVTGASIAKFAHDRIFAPLGMSQTQFLDDTRRLVPNRATAYAPEGTGFVVEMSNWDQLGDGAVQSSVQDLAKWNANFTTGRVGGKRLAELLTTQGTLNGGERISYAAGLFLVTYRGVNVVLHSGSWAGYRAYIARVPSEGLGVIINCNRADASPTTLAMGVIALLARVEPVVTTRTPQSTPRAGMYVSRTNGRAADISIRGDSVFLNASRLHVSSTGTWTTAQEIPQLRFVDNLLLYTAMGDATDTLYAVDRVTTLPRAKLADYTGTYASSEVATPFEIVARGDALYYRLSHGDDVLLSPFYTDAFNGGALPTIRFLRDPTGHVTAMTFTGAGIHDLRLERRP